MKGRFEKSCAVFALFSVLIFLLFSPVFVSKEFQHDCSGEDCPVCAVLAATAETARKISAAVAVLFAFFQFLSFANYKKVASESKIGFSTPISQKIRP